jgi:hypothetical protein
VIFTNADPRYAGSLYDKQGGDTIVTMERVREDDDDGNCFQIGVDGRVHVVVAHIIANRLSLEIDR